ncbi:fibropellin-1-like, partial [Anneissia japonica]|uniref:fibropellin-1-like n=1 Tax=Anneissia japonica TaxID=1529436 RepID=UPI0014257F97
MSILMNFSTFNGKHINTAMHSLLLASIVLLSFCKTSGQEDCMLPVDSGMCSAGEPILRFYYDHTIGNCLPFAYYCDGNSSNSQTIQQCQLACTGRSVNACDSSPCQIDEQCVDNVAGGYCCASSPCNSNPCQNGGMCTTPTTTTYMCMCSGSFSGTNCETSRTTSTPCDSNPCPAGQECFFSLTMYICQTATGRRRRDVEVHPVRRSVATETCADDPCLNGGVCFQVDSCENYVCACVGRYTGINCETDVCSLPLAAGTAATCPGAQVALRYYYADSTSGCTPFAYYCGANANNFESSALCEATCPVTPCSTNPCQNGSACTVVGSSYICRCSDCFTGTNCQTVLSACSNHACQNGAACVQVTGSCIQYTCTCPSCYTGQFCETVLSACSNHGCQNGAACVQVTGSCIQYTCTCPSCYTGTFCET